jgi:hypothetical protein
MATIWTETKTIKSIDSIGNPTFTDGLGLDKTCFNHKISIGQTYEITFTDKLEGYNATFPLGVFVSEKYIKG